MGFPGFFGATMHAAAGHWRRVVLGDEVDETWATERSSSSLMGNKGATALKGPGVVTSFLMMVAAWRHRYNDDVEL